MKTLKDYMTRYDDFNERFYEDTDIYSTAINPICKGKYLVIAVNRVNGVAMLFTATYSNRVYNKLMSHTENNIDEWDILTADRTFYIQKFEYEAKFIL